MWKALKNGLVRLKEHKKALFLGYCLNLVAALIVAIPFAGAMRDSLQDSLTADDLMVGMDYDWYLIFSEGVSGALRHFSPNVLGAGPFLSQLEMLAQGTLPNLDTTLLLVGLLYLVLNSFATAAFLGSAVLDPNGTTWREFLRTGGEFVGRFWRLSVLGLLLWVLLGWLLSGPIHDLADQMAGQASVEKTAFAWRFSAYLIVFLWLGFLNLTMDYGKAVIVVADRTSAVLGWTTGLSFVLRNFGRVLALYLTLSVVALSGAVLYVVIEHGLPQTTLSGVLTALALQQVYLFGRIGLRYLFLSSQMEFYRAHESKLRLETLPAPAAGVGQQGDDPPVDLLSGQP